MAKEYRWVPSDVVRTIVEHDCQRPAPALASDADDGSPENLDDLYDLVGMVPESGTFYLLSVCIFFTPFFIPFQS